MANEAQGRVKSLFNRVFKIQCWSDANRVKGFFYYVFGMFQRLFVMRPKPAEEEFSKAQARLNLTDDMLLKKQQSLFKVSVLMAVFGLGMLFYTVYQCFYGSFVAVALSLIVSLLGWAFAFRYHFWYFQMREKKLGCSFSEWLNQGLLRREKP